MPASRAFLLLVIALTAAGCVHAPGRNVVAAQQPTPAMAADLDSFAYTRPIAAPVVVVAQDSAQARYQHKYQPQPQYRPQPPQQAQAASPAPMAMQARAQVIVANAAPDPAYGLDTGDKLRIVVFGQDGLSNSYFVDAAGQVTIPLIGAVNARGLTTQQLARAVSEKLRAGFIREPHVAIEVETYRPFFILGEVTQPGQYPYVPNMTVETAVAIAGGFTPRAYRGYVQIDRPSAGASLRSRGSVPLLTRMRPGDTVIIKERWF